MRDKMILMANKKNRQCKKCGNLIWDTSIKKSTGLCKKCWSLNRRHNLHTRLKISHQAKERWNNPIYRERASRSQKIRLSNPENHPNWKGGATGQKIRNTKEYKELMKDILARDNYTCQICLRRGGILQVDHIKQFAYFPELRLEPSNLRTLCIDCHKSTPSFMRKIA